MRIVKPLVSSPSGRHRVVEFRGLHESETPLKESRFTESQIVAVLKEGEEGEAGIPVAELCRKHGISNATYYQWKSKYPGVQVSKLQRLRELEQGTRSSSVLRYGFEFTSTL